MRQKKSILGPLTIALAIVAASWAGEKTPQAQWAEAWFAVAADIGRRNDDIRDLAELMLRKNPAWSGPVLREKLHSHRSIDQQTAARLLGLAGTPADEPALLGLYAHGDFFARSHALRALADLYARFPAPLLAQRLQGRFPEIPPPPVPAAGNETPATGSGEAPAAEAGAQGAAGAAPEPGKIAMTALYALYRRGQEGHKLDPETERAVLELARGRDNPPLDAALAALEGATSPAAADAALQVLEIPDAAPATLMAACKVLRRLPPRGSAPRLELTARHADPRVALEADGALWAMGAAEARERLAAVAANPRSPLRLRALALLGERQPDAAFFLGLLSDPDPGARLQAARALGNVEKAHRVDAIAYAPLALAIATDDSPAVRAAAARALAKIDRPRAVAALRDAAQSQGGGRNADVLRAAAIASLGELRAKETLRLLSDATRDPALPVAVAAVKALGALAAPEADAALFGCLGDPRERVAVCARAALYERSGADPGNDQAERERWRERYLR